MILYYSAHVRIFNGEGFNTEKKLLLKIFNNHSITVFCKLIKIFESYFKLNINIHNQLLELVSKFLEDLPIVFPDNKLKILIFKKYFIFYFLDIFSLLNLKKREFDFEYNLFFFGLNNRKLASLADKKALCGEKAIPFFNKGYLPKNFKLFYSHSVYKYYKRSKYLKSRFSFLKVSENVFKRSVFVSGKAYDFYRGSITPFYKSKFSWVVSTGLKADIECDDLEMDPDLFTRKTINHNNFYENIAKDIVFKVYNFKKSVTRRLKSKLGI